MKRISYFICTLLILLSLEGCSSKKISETDMAPSDMAAVIIKSQPQFPPYSQIPSGTADFTSWLSDYYYIQPELVADGIICCADGVEASEVAVLKLTDASDCTAVQESLAEYIQNRAGLFEGYAPQQAAMVKNGVIAVNGCYLSLFICPDTAAAKTAFDGCFENNAGSTSKESPADNSLAEHTGSENLTPESTAAPNETENTYDSAAVLQAWRSGDDSSLSELNKRILDAAKDIIQQEITDDMSDYEKELAIHDWITNWSGFDYSVFGRSSDGFRFGSDTPYGVLIDHYAMCHGYSSTFQLFMDMLDIECITVFGTPSSNGVQHSWNMVKLDDEWYCVDAAWDDPIGGAPCHTYFNVTSAYLRQGSIHRWDDADIPEAVGTKYAYSSH